MPKQATNEEDTPQSVEERLTEMRADLRLSASSLSKYKQCPRRWYLNYVEGRREQAGPEALIGTFVHEVLENLMMTEPHQRSLDDVRDHARGSWDDFSELYAETFPDQETAMAQVKADCWQKIKNLWEWEDPHETEVLGVEIQIDTTIEGTHFIGYIDRLDRRPDGKLVIVDYKSGSMGRPQYLPSKLTQIALYGLGYLEQHGHRPATGKLIYLQDGVVELTLTEAVLKETRSYFKRTAKKIQKALDEGFEEFRPRTGPLCGWCPFITECPEGQREFNWRAKSGRIRTDAPAWKYMGELPPDEINLDCFEGLY